MAIIKFVTHFGDLAVVLPLAMVAMLWFAYIGAKRLIFYWALSLAACMLITIILKMHFISCPSRLFDLRSPSGHSSLSILIYGLLGTIAAKAAEGAKRLAVIAATGGLIALIAISRSILGAHTVMEIVLGLTIGGASLLPLILAYRHVPATRLTRVHLLVLTAALPLALTIESPDTETILSRTAVQLQRIVPMCGTMPIPPEDLAQ